MKSKLKQQSKKLLTMVLSLLMLIGMSVPGMQAFAKDVRSNSVNAKFEILF